MFRLALLLLFFSSTVFAQSTLQRYRGLSRSEKKWVRRHLFIAKKCFHITQRAQAATDSLRKAGTLGTDGNGGQLDAFRHAYWMALLVQTIPERKARSLGEAHERGNYEAFKKGKEEDGELPDSVSCEMDRRNNSTGIALGLRAGQVQGTIKTPLLSPARIVQAVQQGKLCIISKTASEEPLDCSGNLIDMEVWRNKWNIPKCIVPSNKLMPE